MPEAKMAIKLAIGWIEAWQRFDMDWLKQNLADDFSHCSPFGNLKGRDHYLETIEPLARKSVSELRILNVTGNETLAAIRFENETPAGIVDSCDWVRVENGLIQEIRSFYDTQLVRSVLSDEEQGTLTGTTDSQRQEEPFLPVPQGYSRVCPYLNYADTSKMLNWLGQAFGLVEKHKVLDGDKVVHAEMRYGEAIIMMGTPHGAYRNPRSIGSITQSLYVFVDNIDAHHQRAVAAGAEIIEAPADQDYGHRRYGAVDPEGHTWYFASQI